MIRPEDEARLNKMLEGIEEQANKYTMLKEQLQQLEKEWNLPLTEIKKTAFEEGVQHALDVIDASIKGYAVVFKSTNPKFFTLMNLILQMHPPRRLAEIQAEDRVHRMRGEGYNPQNLAKPVDDSVHEVLKNKQAVMDEEIKKWKEGTAKSYFETLTPQQADRVLELVREGKQADKEVNALPVTLHGCMPSEAQKAKMLEALKNNDTSVVRVHGDLCKGDDV